MVDTICIEFEDPANHIGIKERRKQDIERRRWRCPIGHGLTSGRDFDFTLKHHPHVLKLFDDILGGFALPFHGQEIKDDEIDLFATFPCPLYG